MMISECVSVIEKSFQHLFYEKSLFIGHVEVLIHFPSIGIAVLEESNNNDNEDIDSLIDRLVHKELNAKAIYINSKESNFNVGNVINDILLTSGFEPGKTV